MPARRAIVLLFAVLALMGVGAPSALAHHGREDTPKGTLTVPAGGSTSIPIERTVPADTVQWTWTIAPTSPASPVQLSAQLFWTDSSGQERAADAAQEGRTFGTFVAPEDFKSARLVWRNTGGIAADVEWNYGVSASFWRRPDMILPASIPVIFLVAAFVLGKSVDARARGRRQARSAEAVDRPSVIHAEVTYEYDSKPAAK